MLLLHHPALASLRRGMAFLSRFAVDTRYPGDTASKREAEAAQRWAAKVRDACRSILGLRTPRPQRRP
jgi:hypothetical protein